MRKRQIRRNVLRRIKKAQNQKEEEEEDKKKTKQDEEVEQDGEKKEKAQNEMKKKKEKKLKLTIRSDCEESYQNSSLTQFNSVTNVWLEAIECSKEKEAKGIIEK